MNSPSVLACITAYEDQAAVQRCIAGIATQTVAVQALLIIDNSAQPLELDANQFQGELIYQHCPDNIGISGSFSAAIQRLQGQGHQASYEFLWMFDQDSRAEPDCLEVLLKTRQELETQNSQPIGIIAPTAFDSRTQEVVQGAMFEKFRFVGKHPPSETKAYECDAPITSGSLIAIAASQAIGLPQPDFFIDGVDFEYGMALRQQGFCHWICPLARLEHRFGQPITYQWRGKAKQLYQYSPLRHYYMCRNHSYLELRYADSFHKFLTLLWRGKYLVYTSLKIVLFDPTQKTKKVRACWIGTLYGLMGQLKPYSG